MTSTTMRRPVTRICMALSISALMVLVTHAQFGGMIRGKVTDKDGNPLKDVAILIEATNLKVKYKSKSNKKGQFTRIGIDNAGIYRVTAEKEGYRTVVLEGIRITGFAQAGDFTTVDFELTKLKGRPAAKQDTSPAPRKDSVRKATDQAKKGSKSSANYAVAVNEGVKHFSSGQYGKAIESFKEALEKDATKRVVWSNLAASYARMDRSADAIKAYEKALSLEPAEEAPSDAVLCEKIGGLYSEQKNGEKTIEFYQKAAELHKPTNPKDAAFNYYNVGVNQTNLGRKAEAVKSFQKATEADPTLAESYYQLGVTLLGMNKIADSLGHFKKYVEIAPDAPNVDLAKGFIEQLGK